MNLDPDTLIAHFLTKGGYLAVANLTSNTSINRLIYRVPAGFTAHYESTDCTGEAWADGGSAIFDLTVMGSQYIACAQGLGTGGTCGGAFGRVYGEGAKTLQPRSYRTAAGGCAAESPPSKAYVRMVSLGPDGTGDLPVIEGAMFLFCVAE